jgi:hypothetical protein
VNPCAASSVRFKRSFGACSRDKNQALHVTGLGQGNLAKAIMDAAWAILPIHLRYQAESAGAYGDSK